MELMARAPHVSMSKLLLASMAAVASRRAIALFDPSQARASDGEWTDGGFKAPKTSTGKARGSLARRVAIAKPKAAYQKAKAAHATAPTPQAKAKLDKAAARLKTARKEAAAKYAHGNPDGLKVKRPGSADDRRAVMQPAKAEYQRAKAEYEKHGSKDSRQRLDVAHARLTESRTGSRPVDSSTWGERANFDDMVKSGPKADRSHEQRLAESLMARHLKSGDTAGARKVAREHARHRTSTASLQQHFNDGGDKQTAREIIDSELDSTRQSLKDHARGHAGKVLAEHDYRLAKAEAYARLEAVASTRKRKGKKNA